MGWMISHNRKKHQRRINRYVRMMNENLRNDPLWKGRYIVYQSGSPFFYQYEDGSGAELCDFTLICEDKLTGKQVAKTKDGNEWCFHNGMDIWRFVNDAIIYDFDAWEVSRNG